MKFLKFRSSTVRRLDLLVTRDRLSDRVRTLPYSLAWVRACAGLMKIDAQLAELQQAA